ncbi:hypothetical protein PC115_g11007 [Phytophthora cactorum]|uniref:Uncharacterized protein n=1 Tax=Phytophthora cactorum TaxID=29920 RepID=A0A8T1C8N2_9STRA|nr:hypothetical protein PC115_g11007 [Phytophthora cactorum]KAG3059747.1 hypothetical protein PC121_g13809 [Phytophthora cactorum]
MLEDARINGQRRISVILETLLCAVANPRYNCKWAFLAERKLPDKDSSEVTHAIPGLPSWTGRSSWGKVHRSRCDLTVDARHVITPIKLSCKLDTSSLAIGRKYCVRIPMGWATWEQALPKVTRDTFG